MRKDESAHSSQLADDVEQEAETRDNLTVRAFEVLGYQWCLPVVDPFGMTLEMPFDMPYNCRKVARDKRMNEQVSLLPSSLW